MQRVIIGDYGKSVETDTLMVRQHSGISSDIARLKGARYVFATEGEEGKRLAEATIKRLTGNDMVTARFLYGREFEFRPEFKIWFGTNHRPLVRGTDNAIWNRLKLIPFAVTIPADSIDRDLEAKLLTELPGILAWAVQGCLAWQRDGLNAPPVVTEATASYRDEMDAIKTWLAEECDVATAADSANVDAAMVCGAAVLYTSYKDWCAENGERPMSAKPFREQLLDRGFTQHKGRLRNEWHGIRPKVIIPFPQRVLDAPQRRIDLTDPMRHTG